MVRPKIVFSNAYFKDVPTWKCHNCTITSSFSLLRGLGSQETSKLITMVLKPRIFFGSIAWLTTQNQGKVAKIFKFLQNAANRLLLGEFQSSLTTLMSHNTKILSFSDLAVRAHHFFHLQLPISSTGASNSQTIRILPSDSIKNPSRLDTTSNRKRIGVADNWGPDQDNPTLSNTTVGHTPRTD